MSEIRVNDIIAKGGTSAPTLVYGAQVPTGMGITGAGGINITGVATANSFSGNWSGTLGVTDTTDSTSTTTGALTVSGGVGIAKSLFVGNNVTIGGTVTYEDVTNVDSVGIITAQTGVIVTAGRGVQVTAGGLNVDAGIGTFDAGLKVGTGATVFSPASNIITLGTSDQEKVRVTAQGGILFNNGTLVERVAISATALNSQTTINLDEGMVHNITANLGAAGVKPNIISAVGINTELATGDSIAVTIVTAVNSTSNYVSSVSIDGRTTGITTHWVGGSTPSAGGGSGVDIYTFNVIKTASNTFTVVANQTLTSS